MIINHDRTEAALLGSLMRSPELLPDVVAMVKVESFRVDAHHRIYTAILSLAEKGLRPDLASVAAAIDHAGNGADVPRAMLVDMHEECGTGCQAVYFAELVRDESIKRNLAMAGQSIAELPNVSGGSAADQLAEASRILEAIDSSCDTMKVADAHALADDAIDRVMGRASGELTNGVTTGLYGMDAILGGWKQGTLNLLGARPSIGKTALALYMGINAAIGGFRTLIFSLEQASSELMDRVLSRLSGVDFGLIYNGGMSDDETEAVNQANHRVRTLPIAVVDRSSVTVRDLQLCARRWKQKRGVDLVVIDYLQLLEKPDRRMSIYEATTENSRKLKLLARDLNVPILLLSQLNRECDGRADGRPRLSDLRESGAIEQDADTVTMLHRTAENEAIVEAEILKNRNGKRGSAKLRFEGQYQRFGDHVPRIG